MATVYYDDGPGPKRAIKMADRPLVSDKQRAPELDMRRRRFGVGGSTINGNIYTIDGFSQQESMIIASLQLDDHVNDPKFTELTEKGKAKEAQSALRYMTLCRLKHKLPVKLYYAEMAVHESMRWMRASPDFVEENNKWIVQGKFKSKDSENPVELKHRPECKGEHFPCDCPYAGEYVNQVFLEMMASGFDENHIVVASNKGIQIFTCKWSHWKEDGGWWQANKSWILAAYNWGLRWYWEDDRSEASLARVRSLILRFNERQRKLTLKDGFKRRITDPDEIFKLRPVEEDGDVPVVKAWRMRITPVERPVESLSQSKRKHMDLKHVPTPKQDDAAATAAGVAAPTHKRPKLDKAAKSAAKKCAGSPATGCEQNQYSIAEAKYGGVCLCCYRYANKRCRDCGGMSCKEGASKVSDCGDPAAFWCPEHADTADIKLPRISLAFLKQGGCGACGLTMKGITPLDVLQLCNGCYKLYFNLESPPASSASASK